MGWIINFLKKLFPGLFAWLSKFLIGFISPILGPILAWSATFFKKVAIFLLIVAAIGAAVGIMGVAINQVFGSLASKFAPDMVVIGRMLLPSNLSFCISLLVILKLKSLVFYWVARLSEKFIHT